MSGLRQRQKAQRRQEIFDAALHLFTTIGFTATTLEQIAEGAGVSAPTVRNYFGSKKQLLLELLEAPDQQAMHDISASLEGLPPLDAICKLDGEITRRQLEALSPRLWAEIGPLLIAGDLQDVFKQWNEFALAEFKRLLQPMRSGDGRVSEMDLEIAVGMISDLSNLAFLRLAALPKPDLKQHEEHIRKMYAFLINGFR